MGHPEHALGEQGRGGRAGTGRLPGHHGSDRTIPGSCGPGRISLHTGWGYQSTEGVGPPPPCGCGGLCASPPFPSRCRELPLPGPPTTHSTGRNTTPDSCIPKTFQKPLRSLGATLFGLTLIYLVPVVEKYVGHVCYSGTRHSYDAK